MARSWICGRCRVRTSFLAGTNEPVEPAGWVRVDGEWRCLACRRREGARRRRGHRRIESRDDASAGTRRVRASARSIVVRPRDREARQVQHRFGGTDPRRPAGGRAAASRGIGRDRENEVSRSSAARFNACRRSGVRSNRALLRRWIPARIPATLEPWSRSEIAFAATARFSCWLACSEAPSTWSRRATHEGMALRQRQERRLSPRRSGPFSTGVARKHEAVHYERVLA
jgi:hypothetical protein